MDNILVRYSQLVSSLQTPWWALPLRLIIGYGFFAHGYAKLARGPDLFTAILTALHMPLPHLLSWATVIMEILGGLAVLSGLLIPLMSLPLAVILIVAIFSVHLPNGFSSIKLQSVSAEGAHFGQPGYEADLLYLAGLTALVLGGSGPLAVDNLILRGARTRKKDQT